jgi:hypothetical protein
LLEQQSQVAQIHAKLEAVSADSEERLRLLLEQQGQLAERQSTIAAQQATIASQQAALDQLHRNVIVRLLRKLGVFDP